jgi:hypothetical protein
MRRRYCYPQCRDPWFQECADCWKSGGNPPIATRHGDQAVPPSSAPVSRGAAPSSGERLFDRETRARRQP